MDESLSLIAFMKAGQTLPEVVARHLSVNSGDKNYGYLVPFSEFHQSDAAFISALNDPRGAVINRYSARPTGSVDSASLWLKEFALERSDALLFVATNLYLSPVGLLGFVYHGDFRAEIFLIQQFADQSSGLMGHALVSLENFLRDQLGVDEIFTRVHPLDSHTKILFGEHGFTHVPPPSSKTLKTSCGGINFEEVAGAELPASETPEPDDPWIHMILERWPSSRSQHRILTAGPSIGPREAVMVDNAVRYGWNENHSDEITKFERDFAKLVGSDFAIATSSCTGALHLALKALDIGPGDEVVVPDISWVATASAVAYVGAEPVFCEINRESWTLCLDHLPRLISPRTKAIVPVHLYGFPAEIDRIADFARSRGLVVVEDAAAAVGATLGDRSVGTFGEVGCFSFQGAKVLVGGEGGVAVTNSAELASRLRKINSHGRRPGTFMIDEVGHKYAMNNVTAALVRAQLCSSERQRTQKDRIRRWYEEGLSEINGLSFQSAVPRSKPLHWMISITLDPDRFGAGARDGLCAYLDSEGIDTRPTFPSMRNFPMWKSPSHVNPNADFVALNGVNLPSGVGLNEGDIAVICDAIARWSSQP